MGMIAQERYQFILDYVARAGRVRLQDLRKRLGVSIASLRRDVTELEARGLVVRVHGGVMHPAHLGEPTLAQREREAKPAKRAIARAAAALVERGQTVFIDGGSTCLLVGRQLAARRDLTLITNSLAIAHAAQSGEATIILIGGRVRSVSGALVGAQALGALDRLAADWAFIGASGLTREGPSTPELEEAAVKQAWIRRARRRAVVADSGKWGKPAAVLFAPWSEVDQWVVDAGVPKDAVRNLRKQGIQVTIAGKQPR